MTPEGNLLIASPSKPGEKTKYWLINRKGKTLARINLEAWGLSISENFIFIFIQDKEGNVRLVCLKRIGNETTDFKKAEELKVSE